MRREILWCPVHDCPAHGCFAYQRTDCATQWEEWTAQPLPTIEEAMRRHIEEVTR